MLSNNESFYCFWTSLIMKKYVILMLTSILVVIFVTKYFLINYLTKNDTKIININTDTRLEEFASEISSFTRENQVDILISLNDKLSNIKIMVPQTDGGYKHPWQECVAQDLSNSEFKEVKFIGLDSVEYSIVVVNNSNLEQIYKSKKFTKNIPQNCIICFKIESEENLFNMLKNVDWFITNFNIDKYYFSL